MKKKTKKGLLFLEKYSINNKVVKHTNNKRCKKVGEKMKNLKLTKIVLLIITLIVVLAIGIEVFAADSNGSIVLEAPTGNNSANTNTGNTNTNTNNSVVAPTINNTPRNIVNSSSYNNTSLPNTGAEDYTVIYVILGICAVSAIYAYKKVKDYNGIE